MAWLQTVPDAPTSSTTGQPPAFDCPADSARRKQAWREWAPRVLAGAVFVAFISYYGLLCIRPEWGGDFQMYCAGIARLYRDMLHPAHEALALPSAQSTVYTVYLVAVAALGKGLGLTPFQALQLAGVVNLFVLTCSVCYLFSRASLHRRWALPAACFIFCTLCVHWLHYGWSSALILTNFQYLQPYPSTLGWSCAFLGFGLMEVLKQRGRARDFAALVSVLSVLLLTHVLTASWVIGIVGLFALWTSVQQRSLKPLAWAALAFGLSLLAAVSWPYSSFFGQQSLIGVKEGAPFGGFPWKEFPLIYAIGLACFGYLWFRLRRHGFWLVSLLATLGALAAWHAVDFHFGDRYALFALFPLQFVTAEVMAMAIYGLLGLADGLPDAERRPQRPLLWAALMLMGLCWLPSPMMAVARRDTGWGRLPSPVRIAQRPSQHDQYYESFATLKPHLGELDVVLTPVSRAVFDLASVTGASVVASPNAWSVPDRLARAKAVTDFFNAKTAPDTRAAIARQWAATRVLVPRAQFALLPKLVETFGEPLYRDGQQALLAVAPPAPTAEM